MLLFRSEEHLETWLRQNHLDRRGATLSLEQQWRLAQIWYGRRLDPDWRRRTPEEAQEVFTEVGLTGEFWNLSP